MQNFSVSLREMLSSPWRHRSLVTALVKRDIAGRYRGAMLGGLWSFFLPVFMLAVYTLVFSVIFKARWQAGSDSRTEFAVVLFAGLLVFNLFAECVTKAPSLVLSNANYVKKVVFPLEILPVVALGSAVFHMLVSLVVWLIFYFVLFGMFPLTLVAFPLVLLPLMLLTLGISWFLAAIGVFLRDIAQITGVVVSTLMFLSPIFFPLSALPEAYQPLLLLNPLTPAIEMAREVLVWGRWPDWALLGKYSALAVLIAYLGFAWFQKTRKGFADVL